MGTYKKISSGSGMHGVKYENNLILYSLLKAYNSEGNFKLSNGEESALKLDDVILETENFKIYAQAKHAEEGDAKTITEEQAFGLKGNYSFCVYMDVAYKLISQNYLQKIQKILEELAADRDVDDLKREVKLLLTTDEQIKYSHYTEIISNLRKFNNKNIDELLILLDKTYFYLVSNISINLDKFSTINTDSSTAPNFEEIQKCYNFNTELSISKLLNKLNIPRWFINFFLEKFYLIIVTDNALQEKINDLFDSLHSKSEFLKEVIYDDIYKVIEKWQSDKIGTYLTRNEVDDTFFAYFFSKNFEKKLDVYENLIEFNVDSFIDCEKLNFITIVETPRYHLNMNIFQKKLKELKTIEPLFVDPRSNFGTQKLVVEAFLHKKYTHLLCVLPVEGTELRHALVDKIEKIKENGQLLKYKKIILFSDKCNKINHPECTIIANDKWFEKFKLKSQRTPNSLGELESYYIQRELIPDQTDKNQSENEFIQNIISNNNDFFIISDSPGKGKTTLLSSMAVAINKNNKFWAHIIRLNDYTNLLYKHSKSKTVPHLNEFLDIQVNDIFKREICSIKNILILMVDGFDEISPDYKDIVTDFLNTTRSLENVKQIIVTTRVHLKGHLKDRLQIESKECTFSLSSISDDQIINLMGRISKINTIIVNEIYNSIPYNKDFLKIPLHAKMLAELLTQDGESAKIDFHLNLYDLFEKFIEKKLDIYVDEKCDSRGNPRNISTQTEKFRSILDNCTKLALEKILDEEALKKIDMLKNVVSVSNEDLCASGILELSQDSLRFVHNSFQDFLVAKWVVTIAENKFIVGIPELIFYSIIFEYSQSNRFMDSYLEKKISLIPDDDVKKSFIALFPKYDHITDSFKGMFYEYHFIFKALIIYDIDPTVLNFVINEVLDFTAP